MQLIGCRAKCLGTNQAHVPQGEILGITKTPYGAGREAVRRVATSGSSSHGVIR